MIKKANEARQKLIGEDRRKGKIPSLGKANVRA
jgi:hypothetical protein